MYCSFICTVLLNYDIVFFSVTCLILELSHINEKGEKHNMKVWILPFFISIQVLF